LTVFGSRETFAGSISGLPDNESILSWRKAVTDFMECRGFMAAGVAAGIKKQHVLDLGLIYSTVPASVAGVFTRNLVKAAPVLLSKKRLGAGKARAVIVNAGNANCCTGEQGIKDALVMADCAAGQMKLSPEEVFVASTGVIGVPLPIQAIQEAAPSLAAALRPDGFESLSRAIMTTDTVPKLVRRKGTIQGKDYSIVGVAKGAGMIRPDMATLLSFVCTDVEASSQTLQAALSQAVDRTFNRLTIDGDTSTNDTVLAMANGASGARLQTADDISAFQALLDDLMMELARRLVKDGEGVTKLVEIRVQGAETDQAAFRIADTIGNSPLVKTAFFGEDANWGRILGAAGRAGVMIDPDRVDLYFNDVQMVKNGMGCGHEAEDRVTAVLKQPEFRVTLDFHLGTGSSSLLTCDFSLDYVKINADYRS
jgi:glutamate N-acetyltransferase/amino-acid N-acetyltransferase